VSKFKWVIHDDGTKLYEVGILLDGSLHNPRGYPEADVRAAVLAADARRHDRRSQAAKKAVATRQRRTAKRVYEVARRITLNGDPIGPRNNCVICGRGLGDGQSIERGIGSECWQGVLDTIAAFKCETVVTP
jgi:hypothetical protein